WTRSTSSRDRSVETTVPARRRSYGTSFTGGPSRRGRSVRLGEGDVGVDRLAVTPDAGARLGRRDGLEADLEQLGLAGEGRTQVLEHRGVRGLVVASRNQPDVNGMREALHLHGARLLLGDVVDVGLHRHSEMVATDEPEGLVTHARAGVHLPAGRDDIAGPPPGCQRRLLRLDHVDGE